MRSRRQSNRRTVGPVVLLRRSAALLVSILKILFILSKNFSSAPSAFSAVSACPRLRGYPAGWFTLYSSSVIP